MKKLYIVTKLFEGIGCETSVDVYPFSTLEKAKTFIEEDLKEIMNDMLSYDDSIDVDSYEEDGKTILTDGFDTFFVYEIHEKSLE